jgi:acyl-coenzyme A thioesterase PaaI-like protein
MKNSDQGGADINPTIGAMLRSARDFLAHEQSLFRSLELKPLLIGKGRATFSIMLPETFAGGDGAVHGGLYTIILDSIFGLTVFTALEEVMPIATINLRTDYVGAIAPGARAVCAAECEAIRDDVAFVAGRLTAEAGGALLATGAASFMIGTKGPMKGMRL